MSIKKATLDKEFRLLLLLLSSGRLRAPATPALVCSYLPSPVKLHFASGSPTLSQDAAQRS